MLRASGYISSISLSGYRSCCLERSRTPPISAVFNGIHGIDAAEKRDASNGNVMLMLLMMMMMMVMPMMMAMPMMMLLLLMMMIIIMIMFMMVIVTPGTTMHDTVRIHPHHHISPSFKVRTTPLPCDYITRLPHVQARWVFFSFGSIMCVF